MQRKIICVSCGGFFWDKEEYIEHIENGCGEDDVI